MSGTAGALLTLYNTLLAAPTVVVNNISIFFGEEYLTAQEPILPCVVMVPTNGDWLQPPQPGYFKDADPNIDMIWATNENCDLYLWAYAGNDMLPIYHANAVENLRCQILQALSSQDATGLYWYPTVGNWVRDNDAINRYGRAYKLTVNLNISFPDVPPIEAVGESITINPSITPPS